MQDFRLQTLPPKKKKRKGNKIKGKGEEGGIGAEAQEGRDVVNEVPTTAASASQKQGRESTPDVTGSEENHAAERRRVVLRPWRTNKIDENKEKDETSKKGEKDEKKEKDEDKKKAVNDDDKKKNEAKAHTVEEQDVQPPRTPTLEKIIGSFVIPFPVVKPSWGNREIAIWTASYTAHGFRWPAGNKKNPNH